MTFGKKHCAKYVPWADGKIKCEVPKLKAGTYTVKVHTTAGVSDGKRFKVL